MGVAESKQRRLFSTGGSKWSAIKEMRFMISYYYDIDKKMIKCTSTADRAMFIIFKKTAGDPEIDDGFVLTDSAIVEETTEVAATISGFINYYCMVDGAPFVTIEIDGASGVDY